MAFEFIAQGLTRAVGEYERTVAAVEALLDCADRLASESDLEQLDIEAPRILGAMEAVGVAERWVLSELEQSRAYCGEARDAFDVAKNAHRSAKEALEDALLFQWFDWFTIKWTRHRRCRPLSRQVAITAEAEATATERHARINHIRRVAEARVYALDARRQATKERLRMLQAKIATLMEAAEREESESAADAPEVRRGPIRRAYDTIVRTASHPTTKKVAKRLYQTGQVAAVVVALINGGPPAIAAIAALNVV
jgi:hypothetical protein